ncbi:MAG TPA: PucR family transcriptional regulator [Solirubrobacteraceae bacterium]|jgi:DNA-binding PucR family transcriptional regulator|nr:PucR family transcriptional regulator [Solirubrobacteraceae bacterium]
MADWERPSGRVAELIRDGARRMLGARSEELFAQIDAAVLPSEHPIAADPLLAAAVYRSNHANLVHWAQANVLDPGAPVKPNVGPETLAVARDFVRRGLGQDALHGYRVGQNVGWRLWMGMAFELTTDPDELRELLDVTARSIFSFVDGTVNGIAAQIERERDQLTHGTHAQRLEVVTLILEGAPIGEARAGARLGYALEREHTAAIVWSDDPEVDPAVLERGAEAIGRAAGARPLTVLASASALWVWVAAHVPPDGLSEPSEVRIALGPTAAGIAGFRRSHLDALATQRLMHRTSPHLRLASYDEVQVVALATQDEERAEEFVRRTLGEFAGAPPELLETARTYLREQSNAARTARVLFTHRNTILARLARMQELLPAPLEGRALQVALALEILHWRGGA